MSKDAILEILAEVQERHSQRPLVDFVTSCDRDKLHIQLGFPAHHYQAQLKTQLTELLQAKLNYVPHEIIVDWQIASHASQNPSLQQPNIKNIIAVASGKGGVGKSTVAVNVALALLREGAKVGILDADIYGPSQPLMLGVNEKPESVDGKSMQPVVRHGLQSMSMGYLVGDKAPMVWRGPMVSSALQQLLRDTKWQDLDYLIVDLPPGTGDIQLTLSQKIPVAGALVVTTPQDMALLDARRAVEMFSKVKIPVLGLVENMAHFHCPKCGHDEAVFGQGGGERMAQEYDVRLLGSLPLDKRIREQADGGCPTVAAEPDSELAGRYLNIALNMAAQLALQGKDYSAKFPKIVIE